MEKIILSKIDTLRIIGQANKRQAIKNRYDFQTKFQWNCLTCLKVIYLDYFAFRNNGIFCKDHRKNVNPEGIVQLQYMKRIKEKQIEITETYINSIINTEITQ